MENNENSELITYLKYSEKPHLDILLSRIEEALSYLDADPSNSEGWLLSETSLSYIEVKETLALAKVVALTKKRGLLMKEFSEMLQEAKAEQQQHSSH